MKEHQDLWRKELIWSRTLPRKLRYTTFIGDGDCKAYKYVSQINVGEGSYGKKKVMKEECVNRVHKRNGTDLRQLVKEATEEYHTKSGDVKQRKFLAGKGRLTEKTIKLLWKSN